MKKDCVIRVEGNSYIGMGHISRCITLARQLQLNGMHVSFVCGKVTADVIRQRLPDCTLLLLTDNLSEPEDAQHTSDLLAQMHEKPFWLVVDHYGLGHGWEAQQRQFSSYIMAIDDLAREHNCNMVLDQNFFDNPQQRYACKVANHTMLFLGPEYALLRSSIYQERLARSPALDTPRRVFICFGGSDTHDVTFSAMEALSKTGGTLEVDVVMAGNAEANQRVAEYCARHTSWQYYYNHPAPERLMAKADFAIGAGGVMTWERCALGLPSLVISIADNQRETALALHNENIISYLGDYKELDNQDIYKGLQAFMNNVGLRRKMVAKGLALVDGLGATRVCDTMLSYR